MNHTLRPAGERGHANHGWLDSRHSFSFAHYYDPRHMGFRSLRVINDDVVKPGTGFATHGHQDMEIISVVVAGALSHKDSTGAEGIIESGDIQVMNAGTGIRHSEFNASREHDVRFLQIWILPPRDGLPPSYGQTRIAPDDKHNRLALIAGPAGSGAALPLHQDARVLASVLESGRELTYPVQPGRGIWVQMISGRTLIDGIALNQGDGLAIEDSGTLTIRAVEQAEFLLFDLA